MRPRGQTHANNACVKTATRQPIACAPAPPPPPHPNPTCLCREGRGLPGNPRKVGGGGSVSIRGNRRCFPTQPAYAGSVRPPWEFQEGRGAVGPLVFVVTPPPLHQPDLLTFEGCGLSGNPRKADAWWAVAVCTTGSNAAVQLP